MGLYGFKEQFVAPIMGGTKTHTIRANRAHPDKPGNTLYLYTGLRQKGARLLMRATCTRLDTIKIERRGRIFINEVMLYDDEQEQLARRDGFTSHAEMMLFWEGRLPFEGHIIHWKAGA